MLALVAGVSFAIALSFAALGAWMVFPFAGLEIAALAAAFYLQGRHAGDYEKLALADGRLVIEVRDGEATSRDEMNAAWARVDERRRGFDYRLAILSQGREFEVGRHLDGERRRELADTLRRALSGDWRSIKAQG
jgi:uncharacterized membrane protein